MKDKLIAVLALSFMAGCAPAPIPYRLEAGYISLPITEIQMSTMSVGTSSWGRIESNKECCICEKN